MTTYSFIDESGETRLVGTISPAPGGGSQPGTFRHLVVQVDALDLLANGAQTLYEPADGEAVVVTFDPDAGTTLATGGGSDAFSDFTVDPIDPLPPLNNALRWGGFVNWGGVANAGADQFAALLNGSPPLVTPPPGTLLGLDAIRQSSDVIRCLFYGTSTGAVLRDPLGAWAATTAFATADLILASGMVFSVSAGGGGDSGSDASVFDGASQGDTVIDGDLTWTCEGAPPVAGTIFVHLFVATAVAP